MYLLNEVVAMLEVRDLKKVYHDDSGDCLALDGVSFKLPSKGMVFVVGKSGCGKTTLLNTIGGLDQFTSGDILVKVATMVDGVT